MRLFTSLPYEPDFWHVVRRNYAREIRALVLIQAAFLAYLIVVWLFYGWRPILIANYFDILQRPIEVIGAVTPYLKETVNLVESHGRPDRVELVRHLLIVIWLQMYVIFGLGVVKSKQIAKTLISAVELTSNERFLYYVTVTLKLSPIVIGMYWWFWATIGVSGRSGTWSKAFDIDRSIIGVGVHSILGGLASAYLIFILVHVWALMMSKKR